MHHMQPCAPLTPKTPPLPPPDSHPHEHRHPPAVGVDQAQLVIESRAPRPQQLVLSHNHIGVAPGSHQHYLALLKHLCCQQRQHQPALLVFDNQAPVKSNPKGSHVTLSRHHQAVKHSARLHHDPHAPELPGVHFVNPSLCVLFEDHVGHSSCSSRPMSSQTQSQPFCSA